MSTSPRNAAFIIGDLRRRGDVLCDEAAEKLLQMQEALRMYSTDANWRLAPLYDFEVRIQSKDGGRIAREALR